MIYCPLETYIWTMDDFANYNVILNKGIIKNRKTTTT